MANEEALHLPESTAPTRLIRTSFGLYKYRMSSLFWFLSFSIIAEERFLVKSNQQYSKITHKR